MSWEREVITAGADHLVQVNSHELSAAQLVRVCESMLATQQAAADDRARLIEQHRAGLLVIQRLHAARRTGRKTVRIDHLLSEISA